MGLAAHSTMTSVVIRCVTNGCVTNGRISLNHYANDCYFRKSLLHVTAVLTGSFASISESKLLTFSQHNP